MILIDNYDSFTYNLYQLIAEQDASIEVVRSDQINCQLIEKLNPKAIFVSPGPGRPEEAKSSIEIIKRFSCDIPILGICLGMQAMVLAFNGKVGHANQCVHGHSSPINFEKDPLFDGLENPFFAARYHSLSTNQERFPSELKVLAKSDDDEIMAIKHKKRILYGLQFHPESIMTPTGSGLIQNFLKLVDQFHKFKKEVILCS